MKKDDANKIKLGLFVTAAVVLFILGLFFIGQKQGLFTPTIQVHFSCMNVNGLQAGNKVMFTGISVGTVTAVAITSDTTARVDIQLDKRTKRFIKVDAQASIGSEGLMGDKVVNIAPGGDNQKGIEDNGTIRCTEGTSMEDIMVHVKAIALNADRVTSDMADIVDNIHAGKGSVGKLFMDTVFADNLAQAMLNIRHGAGGFSRNMDAASNSFLLKPFFNKKKKERLEKEKLDGQSAPAK